LIGSDIDLKDRQLDPLAMIVNSKGFKGDHFATFPPAMVKPCILAGCPEGGTILNPFGGSMTVGETAYGYRRKAVLIESKGDYCEMGRSRLERVKAQRRMF
jgi:DNA modification methylase